MGAVLNVGVLHFRCATIIHYHLGPRSLSIPKNPSSDDHYFRPPIFNLNGLFPMPVNTSSFQLHGATPPHPNSPTMLPLIDLHFLQVDIRSFVRKDLAIVRDLYKYAMIEVGPVWRTRLSIVLKLRLLHSELSPPSPEACMLISPDYRFT